MVSTRVTAVATALRATIAATLAWRRRVLRCAAVLIVLVVVVVLGSAIIALATTVGLGWAAVASCVN